jgi:hypothetical protein
MKNERKRWLDHPENVTRIYLGLWGMALMLLLTDLLVTRHEEASFAQSIGFYCLYGFAACVSLVLIAKALRRLLLRAEDYYER